MILANSLTKRCLTGTVYKDRHAIVDGHDAVGANDQFGKGIKANEVAQIAEAPLAKAEYLDQNHRG